MNLLSTAGFVPAFGIHNCLFVRASEDLFSTFVLDVLEKRVTVVSCQETS